MYTLEWSENIFNHIKKNTNKIKENHNQSEENLKTSFST